MSTITANTINALGQLLDASIAALEWDNALNYALRIQAQIASIPEDQRKASLEVRWSMGNIEKLIKNILQQQNSSVSAGSGLSLRPIREVSL